MVEVVVGWDWLRGWLGIIGGGWLGLMVVVVNPILQPGRPTCILSMLKGVTISGKVRFWAMVRGAPTWSKVTKIRVESLASLVCRSASWPGHAAAQ